MRDFPLVDRSVFDHGNTDQPRDKHPPKRKRGAQDRKAVRVAQAVAQAENRRLAETQPVRNQGDQDDPQARVNRIPPPPQQRRTPPCAGLDAFLQRHVRQEAKLHSVTTGRIQGWLPTASRALPALYVKEAAGKGLLGKEGLPGLSLICWRNRSQGTWEKTTRSCSNDVTPYHPTPNRPDMRHDILVPAAQVRISQGSNRDLLFQDSARANCRGRRSCPHPLPLWIEQRLHKAPCLAQFSQNLDFDFQILRRQFSGNKPKGNRPVLPMRIPA